MAKQKFYEYKTINSRGAKIHLMKLVGDEHWKFHNWGGPAVIPKTKECEFKKSYFLNGIEYTKDDFIEILKEREGLPWFKSSTMKGTVRF